MALLALLFTQTQYQEVLPVLNLIGLDTKNLGTT